jgi:phosphoribosylamine--glycine ligase
VDQAGAINIAEVRVLVLGSGAREHAIFWDCAQSPLVKSVIAAPGNGATHALRAAVTLDPTSPADVLTLVHERDIDLTVLGPDDVIAAGVADHLERAGRKVFGPSAAAGKVETSKSFARELMAAAGVPHANGAVFDDPEDAREYARQWGVGLVVKADGLALGKGVAVCETTEQTLAAIDRAMVDGAFGEAGRRIIVEECLHGSELSLMCFCDGERAVAMEPVRDYKRARDADAGPNTGGMGAYSPPSDASPEVADAIVSECAQPIVTALRKRGSPYRGCLYVQVMFTDRGPMVIEYNARFGDPETQVVLPRLESDLVQVMLACAEGDLSQVDLQWNPRPTVGVVIASDGYPGKYQTGFEITGLDQLDDGAIAFHAGTVHTEKGFLTSGGRVLTIVADGDDIADARRRAYDNVARVSFPGSFHRSDIAAMERVS